MSEVKKIIGRPRNRPASPILGVLVAKLPPEYSVDGKLNIKALAKALGCAEYSVYRWLDGRPLSKDNFKRLVNISEEKNGQLTQEDLLPFLLV